MNQQEEDLSALAGVAEEVQDFYDRHPYPRPVNSLEKYRQLWQDRQRCRTDYHLFWPAKTYREDQSILIAGCGTSQAAKYALRWPAAQVTGIDFSATSVRYTEELKRKYDLNNLQVYQLPIERVNELAISFDQIVCTGVLHHLAEPDTGLQALRSALKPDGAMHLMVYAPYGRAGIYMIQDYCRRLGVRATPEEIRDLAASLSALPRNHPLVPLRDAPDFHTEAALADALLHPQDRAYSVPQLFSLLSRSGLRFSRWIRQAPYLPRCGALAHVPHASRIALLPPPEQYAAVELFRGNILRHSLIAYRDDQPGVGGTVHFNDESWHQYVPLRLPDTRVIEERLPPGTIAVLINPSHADVDIYLPIDTHEKQLFDGIDGTRSIAQIVHDTKTSAQHQSLAATRGFFERLWQYDQVVFDLSQQPASND